MRYTYTVGAIYQYRGWPKMCTHVINGVPHFGYGNWCDEPVSPMSEADIKTFAEQVCKVNRYETVLYLASKEAQAIAEIYIEVLLSNAK